MSGRGEGHSMPHLRSRRRRRPPKFVVAVVIPAVAIVSSATTTREITCSFVSLATSQPTSSTSRGVLSTSIVSSTPSLHHWPRLSVGAADVTLTSKGHRCWGCITAAGGWSSDMPNIGRRRTRAIMMGGATPGTVGSGAGPAEDTAIVERRNGRAISSSSRTGVMSSAECSTVGGKSSQRKKPGIFARGVAATGNFFGVNTDNRVEQVAAETHGGHRNGEEAPSPINAGIRVPRHVAFVMDGNGRWATKKKMPRTAGHVEGSRRAAEAVEACRALGVEFVTLYAFSTENWNRPEAEVSFLMNLMEKTLLDQRDDLRRGRIRLAVIGELHRLPPRLRVLLQEMQTESFSDSVTTTAAAANGGGSIDVSASGGGDTPTSTRRDRADVHAHPADEVVTPARLGNRGGWTTCKGDRDSSDSGGGSRVLVDGGGAKEARGRDGTSSGGALIPEGASSRTSGAKTSESESAGDHFQNGSGSSSSSSSSSIGSGSRTEEIVSLSVGMEAENDQSRSIPPPPTMTLCLAISYGGRAEVAAAARELALEAAAGRLDPRDIDEDALGRRLSTARLNIPDPDLVVRTSGESRLSNLLLWQAAYTELYVVSKAWPEFRRPDLMEAFREFGKRRRRFGKTPEQAAEA